MYRVRYIYLCPSTIQRRLHFYVSGCTDGFSLQSNARNPYIYIPEYMQSKISVDHASARRQPAKAGSEDVQ